MLLDLVIKNLQLDEDLNDPEEIIRRSRRASAEELLEIVILARKSLRKDPSSVWPLVARMSAYQTTSGYFGRSQDNVLMLVHAHGSSVGNKQSIRLLGSKLLDAEEELRRIIQRNRREEAVGSFEKSVFFLHNLLKEDAAPFLAEVAGVHPSSARRWMRGGGASRQTAFHAKAVARTLFILSEEKNWGEEKTREWFYRPLPSGRSPRQAWAEGGRDLGQEFQRLGLL